MKTDELTFLEQIYKVSPPIFALVVFFIVAAFLHRLGFLNFRDPTEEKWRNKIERDLDDLKSQVNTNKAEVNEVKTRVAILDDRWTRK